MRKDPTMTTSLVRTRQAAADDIAALRELYDRCSPETLERRFHAPLARVPERFLPRLIEPQPGWSLLALQGEEVIGHGCAGALSPATVEVGLVVDDAFQGTGVGTRLMRDLAGSAAKRGYRSLLCLVEPDNEAVLRTVERAGLQGVPGYVDGLLEIHVELPRHQGRLRQPA
jgi:GNAT superfamily N-acetyltransferase